MPTPRSRKARSLIAVPGDIFAIPLADGRYGACRVLRRPTKREHDCYGQCVLVAASDWVWDALPPLDHPAMKRTLILEFDYYAGKGKPCIWWVDDRLPAGFRKVGTIQLSQQDSLADSPGVTGWDTIADDILAQWRWDHDREGYLAGKAAEKAAEEDQHDRVKRKRAEHLASVTLTELLKKNLLPGWKEYPPEPAKRATKKSIRAFIQTLDKAPKPLTEDFVLHELRECVQKLNELNEQHLFVETLEREDLFELFEEILHAAKFPEALDYVNRWRDW